MKVVFSNFGCNGPTLKKSEIFISYRSQEVVMLPLTTRPFL